MAKSYFYLVLVQAGNNLSYGDTKRFGIRRRGERTPRGGRAPPAHQGLLSLSSLDRLRLGLRPLGSSPCASCPPFGGGTRGCRSSGGISVTDSALVAVVIVNIVGAHCSVATHIIAPVVDVIVVSKVVSSSGIVVTTSSSRVSVVPA